MWASLAVVASLALLSHGKPADHQSADMPEDLKALYAQVEQIKATTPRGFACYENLGCFDTANGAMSHLGTLPTSPARLEAKLLLYTRNNRNEAQEVSYLDDGSLDRSNFDSSLPVKFLTHGFGESGYHYWIEDVKNAYLDREPMNIIAVDWQLGAEGLNYIRASVNTEIVGRMIGSLVNLMVARGTSPSNVHLIGFSLGAQASGFAGEWLKYLNLKAGRITGLDPAAPFFTDMSSYGDATHLDPSDADFVDVIHSNSASLLIGGVGAKEPLGHVDYYPNGGQHQRGCPNVIVSTVSGLFGSDGEDEDAICNHRRAHIYFEESIRHPECPYLGFACPGGYDDYTAGKCFSCGDGTQCGHMGDGAASSPARGSLFLSTSSTPQYCGTQSYVEFRSAGGLDNLLSWGQIEVEIMGQKIEVAAQESMLVAAQVQTAFETTAFNFEANSDKLHARVIYNRSTSGIVGGSSTWRMDHLKVFTDSETNYYFCQRRFPLQSGVPVEIELTTTPCSCPC